MSFPLEQLNSLGVPITRLVTDSRIVQHGDTFVAYPGETNDGRRYIAQALERGASAVIWEAQNFIWDDAWRAPNLAVPDLRHQVGWLADYVYGTPSQNLWMVGVTGTNGKTSTAHWIASALNDVGKKCAVIGTLGNGFSGALQETVNTTPDAILLHGLLADYLHHDATAVTMEVSSHGLMQGRVNGVRFDVALLTNLSRDHLDYHGDMASYAASKRKLFDWESLKCAVLNLDDIFGAELAEQLRDREIDVVGYGMSDASLQLAERLGIRMVHGNLLEMSGRGLQLDVHSSWGGESLHSALIGRFNAANLLGALAVLLVSEVELSAAVQSLSKVGAVSGRMQCLGGLHQPVVVIDYAHTPDALEKVLLALREVSSAMIGGKLICVFGCGGERDRGKRAMMGAVVEKFSDHCIVTSDNPRHEDPQQIADEVIAGMSTDRYQLILDRALAIRYAINQARSCDTVLVAGKGHEEYQEINGIKYPFSDATIVEQVLQSWQGGYP